MRTFVALLWLSLSLMLPCEPAACADAGPLAITVPAGFDGPLRSDSGGGVTIAWVKRRPASDGGTLLQVSAIDVGASASAGTRAERFEGAKHYLVEFVRGIGQSVDDFSIADIEQTALAGEPAARVRWTGRVGSGAVIGVMYCVLVGQSVVNLQTQDIGTDITPAMFSAIGAIEGVRAR